VRTIAPFGRGNVEDSVMDRVARVAAGSGRLPPITGSGPQLAIPGTDPGYGGARRATAPMTPSSPPPSGPSGFPEAGSGAPPPASSARLNIHGGTSVAWGETQVEAIARTRRSRWPLLAAALGGVVLLSGAATGAVLYVKHAGATPAPLVGAHPNPPPPPPTPMTLPSGRKDLPPVATADGTSTAPTAAAPVETPSALPSSRVPTVKVPAPPARPARPANANASPPPAAPPAATPPTTPKPAADDLSNIGRR
jgi:hypothetical protein